MLRPYRAVLAVPGARWPALASFVGRLPVSMLSLSIIALVESTTGSYATAGVVAAAYALGSGVGGPLLGRVVDRTSQPAVLVPATLLCSVLLALLALAAVRGAPAALLIAAAAAAGLAFPPVGPCMRTLWSSLLRGDPRLESAFALDASTLEAVFISGPVLVGAVLSMAGATAPIAVATVLLLVGGLLFPATRTSRAWRGEGRVSTGLGPLRSPGLRVLIGSMMLTAIAYGIWNVGFSAFTTARGAPGLIGLLFTSAAGASLLGGLWYGSRTWVAPPSRRYLLLLVPFALAATPLGLARTIPQLCALLFLACLWIAPSSTVGSRLIDGLAPAGTATEAYTLVPTADVLGVAIGSSLAGFVVEIAGVEAALSLSGIGIGLGALLVAVRRGDLAVADTAAVRAA